MDACVCVWGGVQLGRFKSLLCLGGGGVGLCIFRGLILVMVGLRGCHKMICFLLHIFFKILLASGGFAPPCSDPLSN